MEIFAVWSLSHLASQYPTTFLLKSGRCHQGLESGTGKYTDIPQLPQLLREGKIHKPTRSAGSEQNLLTVPFLRESQARPGEKETGKE